MSDTQRVIPIPPDGHMKLGYVWREHGYDPDIVLVTSTPIGLRAYAKGRQCAATGCPNEPTVAVTVLDSGGAGAMLTCDDHGPCALPPWWKKAP